MPSSVIATFSYDADAAVLRVIFRSGAIYDYEEVPANVYNAMRAAKSKGTFLNQRVKPNYRYSKIKE